MYLASHADEPAGSGGGGFELLARRALAKVRGSGAGWELAGFAGGAALAEKWAQQLPASRLSARPLFVIRNFAFMSFTNACSFSGVSSMLWSAARTSRVIVLNTVTFALATPLGRTPASMVPMRTYSSLASRMRYGVDSTPCTTVSVAPCAKYAHRSDRPVSFSTVYVPSQSITVSAAASFIAATFANQHSTTRRKTRMRG